MKIDVFFKTFTFHLQCFTFCNKDSDKKYRYLHLNIHQCIIIMKKFIILLIISLFGLFQLNAQNPAVAPSAPPAIQAGTAQAAVNPNAPIAKWDLMIKDLGEIPQNIPKTAEFTLTNDGKEPLIIKTAKASCGCTNMKFSSEPILPGKSSIVSATYNAVAPGAFTKTVTVVTNADPNPVVLQFKGIVVEVKKQ